MKVYFLFIALVLTAALSGCAAKNAPQGNQEGYYPHNFNHAPNANPAMNSNPAATTAATMMSPVR